MANATKSFLIDKTTKQVIMWGYTDPTKNSNYDVATQDIIVSNQLLDPDIDEKDWYWNEATQLFQDTQP
jgi:hypothetical protein